MSPFLGFSFLLPMKFLYFFRFLFYRLPLGELLFSSYHFSFPHFTWLPNLHTSSLDTTSISELCIHWVIRHLYHTDAPASPKQSKLNSSLPILFIFLFFMFWLIMLLAIPPKPEPFFPFLHLLPASSFHSQIFFSILAATV